MNHLASTIKSRLDVLTEEYAQRLQEIKDYARLPVQVRLDAAQYDLNLVATCLEVGEDTEFIQSIQTRVGERLEQGFVLESLQQALTALEESLLPLVSSVEAAKFLWRTLSQAWNIISQRTVGALQESEARFRDVALSTSDWVWEVDNQGRYTYCSEKVVDVLGYTVQEILGKTPFDLMPPDEAARIGGVFGEIVASRRPIVDLENWNVSKDGREICLLTSGVPVLDAEGNLVGYRGVDKDITERKRAEEELLRLQRSVEQTADGIAVADMEGNIQFVNLAWTQMHGYTPDEVMSKHLSMFHTEEQLQEDVVPFNQRVMESGSHRGEVGHVRRDGTPFPTLMTTALLTDEEGNPVGLVGTATDITERRRLEQQIRESLERRGHQVQISTEVAQEIAAATALDELFQRVVTLVKERFGYYHAQIFRYESALDAVVLVVGYGETGQRMLAEEHRLEMGRGVVGTAAATGLPVLAADVRQDTDWMPNPHLPETKGELAVPIKWRDEVLGILDVQSDRAVALTEDDQLLLEGLCGQIASAIESTRLLEETNVFRQFAEASGQGFGIADLEGNFIYVNPTLCRILGETEPENVRGKSIMRYYSAEQQQHLQNEVLPAVMQAGQWVGELVSLSSGGQITPTLENFFLIRDEKESPRYLAKVVTDIAERQHVEAEMADRLRELNMLYRTMSREGWETFRKTAELPGGYLFDRIAVEPIDDLWMPEVEKALEREALVPPISDQAAAVAPLSVRGEIIGVLGVYDDPQRSLSLEDLTLVEAISEQVGLALESARLFEQTRTALTRVEGLYAGSDRVVRARTMNEVLHALIQSTALQQLDRASLSIFDHPWGDEPPPGMTIMAVWERSGQEPLAPVGTYYSIDQFPTASLLSLKKPTVVNDIATDEHIDENTHNLFVRRLGMRGAVVLPFTVGDYSIGGIVAQSSTPLAISEEEARQMAALADQAATVVQNQRLFEQTQAALEQVQAVHQQYIRQSWQDYLGTRARFAPPAYVYDQVKVASLSDLHLPEIDWAVTQRESILGGDGDQDSHTIALPISLRGQPIGALVIEPLPDGRAWSGEEIEFIESVAAQLALALENVRLLEQTQVRAHRERLIREITDKIRGKTDLDAILQTTVVELGKVLGTSKAAIRLSADTGSASLHTGPLPDES